MGEKIATIIVIWTITGLLTVFVMFPGLWGLVIPGIALFFTFKVLFGKYLEPKDEDV